jgi:hypothetical protein
VAFITHSAHRVRSLQEGNSFQTWVRFLWHNVMKLLQSLSGHLAAANVRYMPVSSPPVLAAEQVENVSCKCQDANRVTYSHLGNSYLVIS